MPPPLPFPFGGATDAVGLARDDVGTARARRPSHAVAARSPFAYPRPRALFVVLVGPQSCVGCPAWCPYEAPVQSQRTQKLSAALPMLAKDSKLLRKSQ